MPLSSSKHSITHYYMAAVPRKQVLHGASPSKRGSFQTPPNSFETPLKRSSPETPSNATPSKRTSCSLADSSYPANSHRLQTPIPRKLLFRRPKADPLVINGLPLQPPIACKLLLWRPKADPLVIHVLPLQTPIACVHGNVFLLDYISEFLFYSI